MRDLFDLAGKKAVVVGGAGDLGASMLEALLEYGASAVVIGRGERTQNAAKALCEKGYDCGYALADISDRGAIRSSFSEALKKLGGIDILVNAAGIQKRHKSEEFPVEDWDDVIEINLTATFLYCQLAAKQMISQGYGKIINVASMLSFFGGITVPAYAASKGGVMQLTKALSNEWAGRGINVNAIAPGYMDTKMNTALINDPGRSAEILARIPQHRWGIADDMKGVTVFLASAASDYMNGVVVPVDGGYLGR
jgi:2-deoxy-D-gluconate 3-dehydrogenase